jgi:hypothetical protein
VNAWVNITYKHFLDDGRESRQNMGQKGHAILKKEYNLLSHIEIQNVFKYIVIL